jgi:hypothetical protein
MQEAQGTGGKDGGIGAGRKAIGIQLTRGSTLFSKLGQSAPHAHCGVWNRVVLGGASNQKDESLFFI